MLHTTPVRQSPPPRTSPRHISPPHQPNQSGERTPLLQRFRFGPLLMSFLVCLTGVGVYMWPRLQVVRLAYRMQTAEQHLRELSQERDQLQFELAALKDPQRIYRVATDLLGMSTPRRDQVVIITREPEGH
jgi:cell division protein FtsL